MAKKNISERERRRLATLRKNKGDDFPEENMRRAAALSQSRFDSDWGRRAANIRWAKKREEQRRKIEEAQQNQTKENQ